MEGMRDAQVAKQSPSIKKRQPTAMRYVRLLRSKVSVTVVIASDFVEPSNWLCGRPLSQKAAK